MVTRKHVHSQPDYAVPPCAVDVVVYRSSDPMAYGNDVDDSGLVFDAAANL